MPVDLSIPIGGMAVPFAVTLHQQLLIQTAFTAKNSTLNTSGDYSFSGTIYMGYDNGGWGAGAPTELHTNSDLGQSLSGVSLGVTGMVFGMEGRVIVGIGAFGFVTGPFLGYSAVVGLTRGSDQVTALVGTTCRGDILTLGLNMGIGYRDARASGKGDQCRPACAQRRSDCEIGGTKSQHTAAAQSEGQPQRVCLLELTHARQGKSGRSGTNSGASREQSARSGKRRDDAVGGVLSRR